MKTMIVKAFVVCAIALSLVAVGASAVNVVDTGVSVCRHDGPHNGGGVQ